MDSVLSQRARKENQHSQSSLGTPRYSALRVLKPLPSLNSHLFNDKHIAQQLVEEFGRITQLLDQCNIKRHECGLPKRHLDTVTTIIELEETLTLHDREILAINQEIKMLKSSSRFSDSPKDSPQNEVFQLAEELRSQRDQLSSVIREHSARVRKWEGLKTLVAKAEQRFRQKFTERLMSYEQFKLRQEERREDDLRRKRNLPPKQSRPTIRLESSIENAHKQDAPSRTMRELQTKKTITEAAIKNTKKKHQNQLVQLNAKLEFLRDEDGLLNEKLQEIEGERAVLQGRVMARRGAMGRAFASVVRTRPL